jgi:CRISPR system Cascade subunit CasB
MEKENKFIGYLLNLAERTDTKGALADLRSGLTTDNGESPKMYKHIVPYLEDKVSGDDIWFYVIAALFASHQNHVANNSIGKAFKLLSLDGSESIEKRFLALLSCREEDLFLHLKQAFSLFKSKNVGIDYFKLMNDLKNWGHPDKWVQKKWARDYYLNKKTEEGEI